MKNNVTVIEKCLILEANAPKWEVYVNGELMTTVKNKQYLSAVVNSYAKN